MQFIINDRTTAKLFLKSELVENVTIINHAGDILTNPVKVKNVTIINHRVFTREEWTALGHAPDSDIQHADDLQENNGPPVQNQRINNLRIYGTNTQSIFINPKTSEFGPKQNAVWTNLYLDIRGYPARPQFDGAHHGFIVRNGAILGAQLQLNAEFCRDSRGVVFEDMVFQFVTIDASVPVEQFLENVTFKNCVTLNRWPDYTPKAGEKPWNSLIVPGLTPVNP